MPAWGDAGRKSRCKLGHIIDANERIARRGYFTATSFMRGLFTWL
jgi:hypothetical protein